MTIHFLNTSLTATGAHCLQRHTAKIGRNGLEMNLVVEARLRSLFLTALFLL